MKKNFRLLKLVSLLLRIVGCLILLLGVGYAIGEGLVEPFLPGHKFVSEDILQMMVGLVGALIGLAGFAASDVIKILLIIEGNTHRDD